MKYRKLITTLSLSCALAIGSLFATSKVNASNAITNKKIGIMLNKKTNPGELNNHLAKFSNFYTHNSYPKTSKLHGDYDLSLNGDGIGDTYFKVHGNIVVYHLMKTYSDNAHAFPVTRYTTVASLIKGYYSTSKQKASVNHLASIIKTRGTWKNY